jgi:hypothetical protein
MVCKPLQALRVASDHHQDWTGICHKGKSLSEAPRVAAVSTGPPLRNSHFSLPGRFTAFLALKAQGKDKISPAALEN